MTATTKRIRKPANYIIQRKMDDGNYLIEVHNNTGAAEIKGTITVKDEDEETPVIEEAPKVKLRPPKKK